MASKIMLGGLFGIQTKMNSDYWSWEKYHVQKTASIRAVIAKGNIIDGIEAKE